jgi:hypothetical protein
MKATPIKKILKKLNLTAYALSQELGLAVPTVYKWTYEKGPGGTGGAIPVKYHKDIMKLAKKLKVELEPADFVAL